VLVVREIDERGRGLFTLKAIPEGAEIIRGYVSLVPRAWFDDNMIGDFALAWDDKFHALVWSAIPLINHSNSPNAKVEREEKHKLIRMTALRDIEWGEEITYDYKVPLWFEPKPPARLIKEKTDGIASK
jgi:SET domain-containing protein